MVFNTNKEINNEYEQLSTTWINVDLYDVHNSSDILIFFFEQNNFKNWFLYADEFDWKMNAQATPQNPLESLCTQASTYK